ncbi:hypothetical protein [Alkalibacter saccharofermentans]|uniref:DUF3887 domain-containing protein n=1 Tax=Alkalibacter saccharofermentans DSM 14828 TaxID=1120975 RepID=A0A1M4ZML5_9FIRM|nr:hypothetical protein [Alkalibacter saccharofermentans]SHF19248.1 Protein of unknown function [Alkalibacter saccharofermentans DSM 14828]
MRKLILIIIALSMVLLSGCSSGADKDDVEGYGTPKVESLLVAMNNDDYENFSKDFGPLMTEALTEEVFGGIIKTQIVGVIGSYQEGSIELVKTTEESHNGKNYISAIYKGQFSQEDGDVAITVWFTDDEDKNVETIVFNSPKLARANG